MDYLILDHEDDARLLLSRADRADAILVPLSAIAHCGIPREWPPERVLPLGRLLSSAVLTSEVSRRRQALREIYDALPSCPFYKTHQILDVFIEKQVIVEAVAQLDGEKHFIDQIGAWIAADGDNDERLRVAALYMRGRPRFHVLMRQRMPRWASTLRFLMSNLYTAMRAMRARGSGRKRFGTGQLGYGAAAHFAGDMAASIDGGALILLALRRPLRGWIDALRLLLHDRPVMLARQPASSSMPFCEALGEIQRRSARVTRLAYSYLARWKELDFYFTVNYGRMIEAAIVRAMRHHGVPVVTMQHALVGHDEWSASQYLDTWLSDAKIVSTATVARSLRRFEKSGDCTYLAATVPILRRSVRATAWSGKQILYVLTGFTRANTMYDNRRVNDALYFESVSRNIDHLRQSFRVLLRSHPYDSRQYDDRIAGYLSRRTGVLACRQEFADLDAAILIDSPSTVLADAIVAGLPVFLINETSRLTEEFVEIARRYRVLFDDIEDLVTYLRGTEAASIFAAQKRFAELFADKYFGTDKSSLVNVIDQWRMAGRRGVPLQPSQSRSIQ